MREVELNAIQQEWFRIAIESARADERNKLLTVIGQHLALDNCDLEHILARINEWYADREKAWAEKEMR